MMFIFIICACLERELLIEKLRVQLARLKRMQFGRSSEQLDTQIAQLELSLEELEASHTQLATGPPQSPCRMPHHRHRPRRRVVPCHPTCRARR